MPSSPPLKSNDNKKTADYPAVRPEKGHWLRQYLGLLSGAALGGAAGLLFPQLVARFGWTSIILWSAVIGGVLSNLAGFRRAGEALTHRQDPWLNLVIGLGLPVIVLVVIMVLVRSVGGR